MVGRELGGPGAHGSSTGTGWSGAELVPGLSSAKEALGVSRHRGMGTWGLHT